MSWTPEVQEVHDPKGRGYARSPINCEDLHNSNSRKACSDEVRWIFWGSQPQDAPRLLSAKQYIKDIRTIRSDLRGIKRW